MRYAELIDVDNVKLETVCEYFGIPIEAHDAMSDIRATRELTKLVYGRLFHQWGKRR